MAAKATGYRGPHGFEKWVGAAFLRILGAGQAETAAAVGVGERTVRRWESHPDWPKAVKAAEERWFKSLDQRMRLIMEARIANLAEEIRAGSREAHAFLMWWAERRFPEFAPPAKKRQAELLERPQYIVGAIPGGLIRCPPTIDEGSAG